MTLQCLSYFREVFHITLQCVVIFQRGVPRARGDACRAQAVRAHHQHVHAACHQQRQRGGDTTCLPEGGTIHLQEKQGE